MLHDASQQKVQESYDRVADEYTQRIGHELEHKPFDRELLDAFAAQVRGKGPVADLGCGPGMAASYLRERGVDAFGVDLSPRMVACAGAMHPNVEFRTGDFMHLEVADGALTAIVSLYALVHLTPAQVRMALAEFHRALRPGGLLLLAFHVGSEVRHATDWWGKPVDLDFVFFETNDMLAQLWGAGFDTEYHVERGPYPDAELQTQRSYILARKPQLLALAEDGTRPGMAPSPADRAAIYRIVNASDWQRAQAAGVFAGTEHDARDGFIHFSAADQVAGTLAKYYAGQPDLLLLQVATGKLPVDTMLKWEASRDGALFPHLYGTLPVKAVQRVETLPIGSDGLHHLPEL